jgi:hypothetical protein
MFAGFLNEFEGVAKGCVTELLGVPVFNLTQRSEHAKL